MLKTKETLYFLRWHFILHRRTALENNGLSF